MDAIELLLNRASAAKLEGPAPEGGDLDQILLSAMRAADHGRLRPWQFVVIQGEALERFGEVLADYVRRDVPSASDEMLERERAKARRSPMIICVAARINMNTKIPPIEQILSAGAACQNILLAANALGYGAVWKTGPASYDDHVKAALGLQTSDAIVGFIYLGKLVMANRNQPPSELGEWVSHWSGS